jgi:hypothetical protein
MGASFGRNHSMSDENFINADFSGARLCDQTRSRPPAHIGKLADLRYQQGGPLPNSGPCSSFCFA